MSSSCSRKVAMPMAAPSRIMEKATEGMEHSAMEPQDPNDANDTVDLGDGGDGGDGVYIAEELSAGRRVELPYKPEELKWDSEHCRNADGVYCYCGRDRNVHSGRAELACATCLNWFHVECVQCRTDGLLPFMLNYRFTCALCDSDGVERLSLFQPSWKDILITTFANLKVQYGDRQTFFNKKDHLCPFMDSHWATLCKGRSKTSTWAATVGSKLYSDDDKFESKGVRTAASPFALRNLNLHSLRPPPQSSVRVSQKRKQDTTTSTPVGVAGPKRARRTAPLQSGAEQPARHLGGADYPINRPQYSFYPAENDPLDKFRVREALPHGTAVVLSRSDKAAQLRLSDDLLTVTGERGKGYCTVRATQGVSVGTYFWEAIVRTPADCPEGHTRIGWGQRTANTQTPLGCDIYGYSYRDLSGTCFHQGKGRPYGQAYGNGDVVGMLIHLPDGNGAPFSRLPPPHDPSSWQAFTFKNRPFIQETHLPPQTPESFPGAYIEFFVNGVSQGIAFRDITQGTYFPAVSVYMGAMVETKFEPPFKFPPPSFTPAMAMSEAGLMGFASVVLEDVIAKVVELEAAAEDGSAIARL